MKLKQTKVSSHHGDAASRFQSIMWAFSGLGRIWRLRASKAGAALKDVIGGFRTCESWVYSSESVKVREELPASCSKSQLLCLAAESCPQMSLCLGFNAAVLSSKVKT